MTTETKAKSKAELPPIGSEQLFDICPWNDETWMAYGRVIYAYHDCESCDRNYAESGPTEDDRTWVVAEITRAMTEEENPDNYQSDDSWNGAVVVAFTYASRAKHLKDWRAEYPANDFARERWGTNEVVTKSQQA